MKKEKKLRIFFNSNAMWSTSGYGQQILDLLPRIKDAGYPLAICNFFGQQGGKFMYEGIMQYPQINHVYGSDAMVLHARDFNADVVFSLQDIWVLHPQDLGQVKRWIPITPIDHEPVPRGIIDILKFAYKIITYSNFGHKQLSDNGIFSTYIPHTVDTNIFKPMDKVERKKKGGLPPDSFLFGMVAANKDNPPRKAFQEVIDAFKLFLDKEPKALLYIHSNPQFPGGFDFMHYANFLGIRDKVIVPDMYQMQFNTTKEKMALIYNTFDCLLAPSIHEGFCVPLIEAQACGVPVITNNWTSMRELVKDGETGYIVDVSSKRFSQIGSYMAIPSVPSIVDKMIKIKNVNRVQMGKNARKFIVDEYDTDKIFEALWLPYLEKLEREVYGVEKQ